MAGGCRKSTRHGEERNRGVGRASGAQMGQGRQVNKRGFKKGNRGQEESEGAQADRVREECQMEGKGEENRKNRKRKPREERESRAKTKTEMGLVTATAGAAGLTLTRGPSTATHRQEGRG